MDPEDQDWIIQEAVRYGMPLPEKIQNAPELQPGLELYYKAFHRLSTCRQVGMGLGPIPWTAASEYVRIMGLDAEQAEALRYHIERMDNVFLDWHSKQNKKD